VDEDEDDEPVVRRAREVTAVVSIDDDEDELGCVEA
jgi:hypothetical protein